MDNNQKCITNNAQETQEVGERLATRLLNDTSLPRVLCLYGNLGAGKTTFIQGFAKGLGLPSRVVSPTFLILKRYNIEKNNLLLYHLDLYRIEEEKALVPFGLSEIFQDPHAITVIEWANVLGTLLPKKRIDITLLQETPNKREIVMTYV